MLRPEQLWLAREPVDMRRGIDTLTQYVTEQLQQPWQDEAAFVFCNKARTRIKVLRWDKHGVWLCQRRLHRGHFIWPRKGDKTWLLTLEQFDWLIKGIDWQKVAGETLDNWHF
ncbi:IS66 family insertion sequence element accessory protein TnpB [Serratia quinivorans]|uniref:IS66 family insertion sequence element accessory protein TnpB n=1 Tax=Serratia quinivorans TaxID=137545 RepID=UPI0039822A3F